MPSPQAGALFDELHTIAQQMLLPAPAAQTNHIRVKQLLHDTLHLLETVEDLEAIKAEGFLQTAALIMFHVPNQPELISACVRVCSHLVIVDPNFEFAKKRIILQQFATPIDLIYTTRICFTRAFEGYPVRKISKSLSMLSDLMRYQQDRLKIPSVFHETFEYVIGTLEYFAFLPQEIRVSGEDFMPLSFLTELERSMGFYPVLASYREAV